MIFKYIDDIDDWLEPLDYEAFWQEIKPYCLILQSRDHCDSQIESGAVDEATVLEVLKYLARIELGQILKLDWRDDMEFMAMH